MTVEELANRLDFVSYSISDSQRNVIGGYTGDLLSWVMGRAQSGEAWVTIMSNRNIVAVASLTDVALIVLAEGVSPDEGVAELAKEKGINIFGTEMSSFAASAAINSLLNVS